MNELEIDESDEEILNGLRLPIRSQIEVDNLGLTDYVIIYKATNLFYGTDHSNPKFDKSVNKGLKALAKKQFYTACSLKVKYSNEITNYVFDIINKNVRSHINFYIDPIFKKAKLISHNNQSESDYLKKILSNLSKEITFLDVAVDTLDMVRGLLVDYIGIEGVIEFIHTKRIKSLLQHDLIKDAIKTLTDFGVIEKIKERIQQLTDSNNSDNSDIDKNPHPRIFINKTAFEMFQHLKDRVNDNYADYSFFFHSMKRDAYIYEDITGVAFMEWLNKTYGIELTQPKLKSISKSHTNAKENIYKTAKQLYRP